MSKMTEDAAEFGNAVMDTSFDAICLKKHGETLRELFGDPQSHGLLVYPYLHRQVVRGSSDQAEADRKLYDALFEAVLSDRAVVTVRGHGWGITGDAFVWKGTLQEFRETWSVD